MGQTQPHPAGAIYRARTLSLRLASIRVLAIWFISIIGSLRHFESAFS